MADILTIDDDAAIRALIRVHLEQADHSVREAANGQLGLDMVQAAAPDLIILDVNMPVMDGTRTVQALRAQNATKTVPIIALSAITVPQMRDDMHQLGCDAYVEKPINFSILKASIERLLKV